MLGLYLSVQCSIEYMKSGSLSSKLQDAGMMQKEKKKKNKSGSFTLNSCRSPDLGWPAKPGYTFPAQFFATTNPIDRLHIVGT